MGGWPLIDASWDETRFNLVDAMGTIQPYVSINKSPLVAIGLGIDPDAQYMPARRKSIPHIFPTWLN